MHVIKKIVVYFFLLIKSQAFESNQVLPSHEPLPSKQSAALSLADNVFVPPKRHSNLQFSQVLWCLMQMKLLSISVHQSPSIWANLSSSNSSACLSNAICCFSFSRRSDNVSSPLSTPLVALSSLVMTSSPRGGLVDIPSCHWGIWSVRGVPLSIDSVEVSWLIWGVSLFNHELSNSSYLRKLKNT